MSTSTSIISLSNRYRATIHVFQQVFRFRNRNWKFPNNHMYASGHAHIQRGRERERDSHSRIEWYHVKETEHSGRRGRVVMDSALAALREAYSPRLSLELLLTCQFRLF